MTKKELAELLSGSAISHGFTRRGNAFFRVVGDGIFQCIKFSWEPAIENYSLGFGLLSMYSDLHPQHFTSGGCLNTHSVSMVMDRKNTWEMLADEGVLPARQIAVLDTLGYSWLDSITTQAQLSRALCELDRKKMRCIRWNDWQKLYAFLASNNYESAEHVICATLKQHASGGEKIWPDYPWQENVYKSYIECFPSKDTDLLNIHTWLKNSNFPELHDMLLQNYKQNCKSAKFCMKS